MYDMAPDDPVCSADSTYPLRSVGQAQHSPLGVLCLQGTRLSWITFSRAGRRVQNRHRNSLP